MFQLVQLRVLSAHIVLMSPSIYKADYLPIIIQNLTDGHDNQSGKGNI
uniref:Uncharacterized protein n=1 Tax=Tetranychus urticae TaxID=32264 RepID=T1JSC0_TETUR